MQTKLFIDGEFVDAVAGGKIAVLNPFDNSRDLPDRRSPRGRRRSRGRSRARQRRRAGADGDPSQRGRLLLKLADAIEANADDLTQLESRDTGHPVRDARSLDVPRTVACFRYFGGMADKFEGFVPPVDAGLPQLCAARAGRRGRPDRAVEFPADVHQLEDGAGAGRRQHDRA